MDITPQNLKQFHPQFVTPNKLQVHVPNRMHVLYHSQRFSDRQTEQALFVCHTLCYTCDKILQKKLPVMQIFLGVLYFSHLNQIKINVRLGYLLQRRNDCIHYVFIPHFSLK